MKSAGYRLLQCLVLVALAAIAVAERACAGEITFYEQEGFGGRSFGANQSISNFANVGFNDRAASAVVRSGTWQLCSDAYFRGHCVTVSRGDYPSLRSLALDNRVSSVREMEWLGGAGSGGQGGGATAASGRPSVDLFENANFAGRPYTLGNPVNNLAEVGFNDRAQSIIVRDGVWEACEHANFGGTCQTFAPGRYANLGVLSGRISSIRIGGTPWPGIGSGVPPGGAWGSGSRAVLYEGQALSGRSFVINNEVASNLANSGFNDRAASLRIEAGYWVFCSDANFGGECQTFGPGDYPTLPWGLVYKISSGRRISNNYPYTQTPSWQR